MWIAVDIELFWFVWKTISFKLINRPWSLLFSFTLDSRDIKSSNLVFLQKTTLHWRFRLKCTISKHIMHNSQLPYAYVTGISTYLQELTNPNTYAFCVLPGLVSVSLQPTRTYMNIIIIIQNMRAGHVCCIVITIHTHTRTDRLAYKQCAPWQSGPPWCDRHHVAMWVDSVERTRTYIFF